MEPKGAPLDAIPTNENLDRVLAYLPYFENRDNAFYDLDASSMLDPYIYSPEVQQFVGELYSQGFIVPFDWGAWQEEAERYAAHPDLLQAADIATIRKLLTTHVRKDRFVSGNLAFMIDCGQIAAILHRLKAIGEGRANTAQS